MNGFEVYLPPRILSPNGRPGNHHARARAVRKYRGDVLLLARSAKNRGELTLPDTPLIGIRLDVWPRSTMEPDDDNVIGSFKAGRDGIADAFGVDDKRFRYLPVRFHPREQGKDGWMVVSLHPLTE